MIKLKSLDPVEIVSIISNGLREQGCYGVNEDGYGTYINNSGRKCAIGLLIDEEDEVIRNLSMDNIDRLVSNNVIERFLIDIVDIHDKCCDRGESIENCILEMEDLLMRLGVE